MFISYMDIIKQGISFNDYVNDTSACTTCPTSTVCAGVKIIVVHGHEFQGVAHEILVLHQFKTDNTFMLLYWTIEI